MGSVLAKELLLALKAEVLKAGGHPLIVPELDGDDEIFFKFASDEQLTYFDDIYLTFAREFAGYIQIFSDYNTKKFSNVDPKKLALSKTAKNRFEMMRIANERELRGEFYWTIVPYPCQAFAQEANMDLYSYTEFVSKALLLDKKNPIEEWRKIKANQEKLANYLKSDFINLTNVKGLYDKNPKKFRTAKFIPEISHKDFLKIAKKIEFKPGQHFVLDQKAAKIIKKYKIKTYILGQDLKQLDNVLKNKHFVGTLID